MQPMTNSQIAAQKVDVEKQYATKDGAPPIPPVLQSYSYGWCQLVWAADGLAEVRDGTQVLHVGSREECAEWIARKSP